MSRELILRRWVPQDQDAVIQLHILGLQSTNAYAGRGPWDSDLDDIESAYLAGEGEFLVGLLKGRLIAMGAVRVFEPGVAEVKRMRVHPDFQRRGFGQRILELLEKRAIELGCTEIRLDTSVLQTAAQALYKKNGYIEVGRRKSGGPFELILFEKALLSG